MDFSSLMLMVYGEGPAEDLLVVEQAFHEEQLSECIKRLSEALVQLRSHKKLLEIAHSLRG